jgi:hypothetical protein
VVESFTDQFSGGQQDVRRLGWQRVQLGDEGRALLLRHPPMRHERRRCLCGQGQADAAPGASRMNTSLPLFCLAGLQVAFIWARDTVFRIAGTTPFGKGVVGRSFGPSSVPLRRRDPTCA